ncbi:MAG: HAD family hydrolase [bacterium]|nr:HAD family hydrolase [bacterium]
MKLVIFDLDGTLVDVFSYHIKAFVEMIKEVFSVDISGEEMSRHFGKPIQDVIMLPLLEKGVKKDEIKEKMQTAVQVRTEKFEELLPESRDAILPGVIDVLDELKEKCVLALATGNNAEAGRVILKKTGLNDYFKIQSFCSEATTERREIIEKAKEEAGEVEEVYVVGDSVHDIRAGKEAGFITIGVATYATSTEELRQEGADFVFESINELIKQKII